MKIINTISKGFTITNKNIKMLFIIFIFNIIAVTIKILLIDPARAGKSGLSTIPFVLSIILALVNLYVTAGILGSIKEYIKTQKNNLSSFFKNGAKYYIRIFIIYILITLLVGIFLSFVLLINAISAVLGNMVVAVILIAIILIASGIGVYFFVPSALSPYIMIAEDTGAIGGIKRSVRFFRNNVLEVVGLLILLALIRFGIFNLPLYVTMRITSAWNNITAVNIVVGLATSTLGAYASVLFTSCYMLYYMSTTGKES